MISAKEREIVLVKLSDNETFNDLQNVLEAYEIKSAIVRGFGSIKAIECEDKIIDAGDAIIEGTVSELDGRPHITLYCHTLGTTGKIKNFIANNLLLTLKLFQEIRLISRKNERGEVQLTIANESVKLEKMNEAPPETKVPPKIPLEKG
jgi:hypothetical protein